MTMNSVKKKIDLWLSFTSSWMIEVSVSSSARCIGSVVSNLVIHKSFALLYRHCRKVVVGGGGTMLYSICNFICIIISCCINAIFLLSVHFVCAGTPINKGPCVGNKDLNLYRLFRVVQNIGGYNKVVAQKHS